MNRQKLNTMFVQMHYTGKNAFKKDFAEEENFFADKEMTEEPSAGLMKNSFEGQLKKYNPA